MTVLDPERSRARSDLTSPHLPSALGDASDGAGGIRAVTRPALCARQSPLVVLATRTGHNGGFDTFAIIDQ
jgi:hypothetical protein